MLYCFVYKFNCTYLIHRLCYGYGNFGSAVIATIVPFQKIRMLLLNEKFAVTALIMSALVVFVMGQILKNEFINNIVFGYFNRSYTVTGRLEIYNDYLLNIIRSRFWFGYGYSNSMMKNMTGLYANAQNGLLEIMVNMGFLSVVSINCYCLLEL